LIDTYLYPWNQTIWDSLIRPKQRLPHGLIFCGSEGLGKLNLAMRLSQQVLCASPDSNNEPCDECRNCHLFAAGTHPDFHFICSEEAAFRDSLLSAKYGARYLPDMRRGKGVKLKSVIGVDQIRALIDKSSTHTHIADHRVILISPAQAMNINAANALLKLLEEPPASTLIILVCITSESLPATIRSRCMQIPFAAPDRNVATNWIKSQNPDFSEVNSAIELANCAPLKALEYLESGFMERRIDLFSDVERLVDLSGDPIKIASNWKDCGTQLSINWLHGLICDLVYVYMSKNPPRLFNSDLKDRLKNLLKKINLQELFNIYHKIGSEKMLVAGPLDDSLFLEETLIYILNSIQGRNTT